MSVSNNLHRFKHQSPTRARHGNIIVFISAVTFTVLLALILFALGFTRILGTSHEQRSGAEAAALAAAKDLSRIVINDSNFGFVGISDSAPIGGATIAPDGYALQVHGINTLLGTVRLDMIVADAVGDPVMMQFAQRDYINVRKAGRRLVNVLQQSLMPAAGGSGMAAAGALSLSSAAAAAAGGGNFVDCFGNPVSPYEDAVAAYQANGIRMAGNSKYVDGSMKLTLGLIDGGGPTNTPVPQPSQYSNVQGNQSLNGNYTSYVDVPYNNTDFVFAGIGDAIKLVDTSKFVTGDNGLPYTIPTVVKAEADQILLTGQDVGGRIVHGVSCAQPASTFDPLPAPGKLSISFPDKLITTIGSPGDLLTDPHVATPPTVISTPHDGDFPGGSGSLAPATWPIIGTTPSLPSVVRGGLHDWLRRGGVKVNVDAFKSMLSQSFVFGASLGGLMENYEFAPDGTIIQTTHLRAGTPAFQESQNQIRAHGSFSLPDSAGLTETYQVTVRDWVFQPGLYKGGKHAGEPLPDAVLDTVIIAQNHITGGAGNLLSFFAPTNQEIAQGLERGAGGIGAGSPPCGGDGSFGQSGGCTGGDGGDDDEDGGSSCNGGSPSGSQGGSYGGTSWGGSCGGSTGGSCGGSTGGSNSGCGSGGSSNSGCGGAGGLTGGGTSSTTLVSYPNGPGAGPGAVRPTYLHNGLDVEIEFALAPGGGNSGSSGTAAAASP